MAFVTVDLPEELILEIIFVLPLKSAIQCKCLNKRFNELIPLPKLLQQHGLLPRKKDVFFQICCPIDNICTVSFVCHRPVYFYWDKILLKPPSFVRSYGPLLHVIHMFSTNSGRLLLESVNFPRKLCIFNPLTGAYFFPTLPSEYIVPYLIGLVDDVSSHHYKLVAMVSRDRMFWSAGDLKFLIFESESNSWHESANRMNTEQQLFVSNSLHWFDNSQPVYSHGCLHWLKNDGTVLVFDVNNELPGTIERPAALNELVKYSVQFGDAGGSLALAIATEGKVLTYGLDHVEQRWRFANIIEDMIPGDGQLVYYDGENVIFLCGCDVGVYLYKIGLGECHKFGKLNRQYGYYDLIGHFRPFFPTLATIPRCKFLKFNEELRGNEDYYEMLQSLHHLQSRLLPPDREER